MSFNLTVQELEKQLQTVEYALPKIQLTWEEKQDVNYKAMEESNGILGRSFQNAFRNFHVEHGRIPTPQEFINMQMIEIRENFGSVQWRNSHKIRYTLTGLVEKGVKQRLLRSYISFITELHTELLILDLYPDIEIERSVGLDYAGIDILANDKKMNVTHEIHITKNSPHAIQYLFKKEGKELVFEEVEGKLWASPRWKHINHPVYSERDFTGHVFLLYDAHGTYTTKIIHGYPLFRRGYILNKLEANYFRKLKS